MLDKLTLDPERPRYFEGYGNTHNRTHKCALYELPYMSVLILMHNIDVMQQERNMGESIISTCMSFSGKTKDNMRDRQDLAELCNRPSLELKVNGGKPRASFCLKPQQRKEVMRLMKGLKFPDGYAASLRRSVNMTARNLTGLKSHDYHIIMDRLLPVMFRGYFDDVVWMVLAEVSYFYRQLCAKEIAVEMMQKLEEIPVLLCNMEKKFLPGFSIQCNISLYIFHMKLKWVVFFNIGGCITLKVPSDIVNQWLVIGQGLNGASPKHLCLRRYYTSQVFTLQRKQCQCSNDVVQCG
jgi:hypothetical protein